MEENNIMAFAQSAVTAVHGDLELDQLLLVFDESKGFDRCQL